jgi:beta-glucosidase
VGANDWVKADVKVRNSGRRPGDDTVLAFVTRPDGGRQLVAFPRVHLDRGEGTRVRLSFPVSQLAVTGPSGQRAVAPGTYRLTVEGESETFRVG